MGEDVERDTIVEWRGDHLFVELWYRSGTGERGLAFRCDGTRDDVERELSKWCLDRGRERLFRNLLEDIAEERARSRRKGVR